MFVENGDKKQLLKNLVIEYNNKRNNKSDHENSRLYKSKEFTLDSRHQSKNETYIQENRERYYIHVEKKPTTKSLSKE